LHLVGHQLRIILTMDGQTNIETMNLPCYNDCVDSSKRFIQIRDLKMAILGRWRHVVRYKFI